MPVGGTYYCYVPPQGVKYAPWNEENGGWSVICLAKNPEHAGVHVVGWYEDATLHGEWRNPPELSDTSNAPAFPWSYCISSQSAFFVPPDRRTRPFSHDSIRQGKYSFLAGPNVETTDKKRRLISILETELRALRPFAVHNPSEENIPDPELDPIDPLKGFGTPEHRRKVEKASEAAVIAYYEKRGFEFDNCTKLNCGYDFRFYKSSSELHVEIKGTSSELAGFFLTRNEHAAGFESNPAWRLAMVTRALSTQPRVSIFSARQLRKAFELTPYVFLGRPIVSPKVA
jgi:hypothetical protein